MRTSGLLSAFGNRSLRPRPMDRAILKDAAATRMSTARPSIAIRTSLVELVATSTVSSLICPPPTIVNSSSNKSAISSPSGAGNVGPMENDVVNVNLCWLTAGSIKREGRREAVQFISTDSGSWSSEWIFPVGLPRSRTAPSFSVSSLPSIQLPTFWCRRFVPPRVLATQPGMRSGYRPRLRALAATGSTPGNSWHQGARQNPLPAP